MPALSHEACPVCGGGRIEGAAGRARELQLPPPFDVRVCGSCGHCFLSPYPSPDDLAAFYAQAEGYAPTTLGHRSTELAEQHAHLLETVEALGPPGRRLLDFGCGEGAFLRSAVQAGWQSLGYEPTARLAAAARDSGAEAVHEDDTFAAAPIAEASLDVIHTSHAVEHVPDPRVIARAFAARLRPGGILSIQVPNQFEDLLWPVLHERWIRRGKPLGYHVHHLQFFTVDSLARLVQDAGFDVLECTTRFALRNRRTVAQGKLPVVRIAKTLAYRAAGRVGRGPHIELFARRP